MATVTGVVEGVSTKFGKYSVLVNGTWYGTKEEWAHVKPNKGDTISFDDGGRKYLSKVSVVLPGTSTTDDPLRPASIRTEKRYRANGEAGGFPIHPLAYERALDRRNALTAAVTLIAAGFGDKASTKKVPIAEEVIALAKKLEAYSTGDIEREMAEEMFAEEEKEREEKVS